FDNDQVYGGSGDDLMTDLGGNDQLNGDSGEDVFKMSADRAEDVIDGGDDLDIVDFTSDNFSDFIFTYVSRNEFYTIHKGTGEKDIYKNIEYIQSNTNKKIAIDDFLKTMPFTAENNISLLAGAMAGFGIDGSGMVEGFATNDQYSQSYLTAVVDPKHTV
ncbi:MAG: hypothetical protein K1X44_09015, partial [Alphaproteobacteria bacterium]|nr:hypothetical protein [Alphaproteobacteria bacterium]